MSKHVSGTIEVFKVNEKFGRYFAVTTCKHYYQLPSGLALS